MYHAWWTIKITPCQVKNPDLHIISSESKGRGHGPVKICQEKEVQALCFLAFSPGPDFWIRYWPYTANNKKVNQSKANRPLSNMSVGEGGFPVWWREQVWTCLGSLPGGGREPGLGAKGSLHGDMGGEVRAIRGVPIWPVIDQYDG